MTDHQVVMTDEVSRLANAARASNAPEEVTERVRALIEQARALLDGHTWPGPYAVEQLAPPGDGMLVWEPGDLRKTVPYSPILGELNPIAGEGKLWADGNAVRGTITTRPIHAGPIGSVHGGIVAAILDELSSLAVLAIGGVGYTQTLTVSYRRPTPLGAELELWAQTSGRTGNVFLTSAEVLHAGRVTAFGVGVHKAAGHRDESVYPVLQ
jgi:acyl-coenzyme A thioesterase PaaI-like protein